LETCPHGFYSHYGCNAKDEEAPGVAEIDVFIREKPNREFVGVAQGFDVGRADSDVKHVKRLRVNGAYATVEIWVNDRLVKSIDLDEDV